MNKNKLYIHDMDSFRFQDYVEINDDLIIADFLYGYCHIFALALIEHFKEKAEGFYIEVIDNNQPCLAHAYVKINGVFVDARGVVNLDEINNYAIDFLEYTELPLSKEKIIDKSTNAEWGYIDDLILSDVQSFIAKHEDIYSGTFKPEILIKYKDFFDDYDYDYIVKNPNIFI